MSLNNKLKAVYDEAALNAAARQGLNSREMHEYQKVITDYKKTYRKEEEAFVNEFQTRFDQERERVINERGSLKHDQLRPHWGQRDLFRNQSVDMQTDRNVRRRHQKRLDSITHERDRQAQELFEKSERRQDRKGHAKNDFNHSRDRRSGEERRNNEDRRSQSSSQPYRSTQQQSSKPQPSIRRRR